MIDTLESNREKAKLLSIEKIISENLIEGQSILTSQLLNFSVRSYDHTSSVKCG